MYNTYLRTLVAEQLAEEALARDAQQHRVVERALATPDQEAHGLRVG